MEREGPALDQLPRRIVELTSEGIWAIDRSYRTTLANAPLAAMLGTTPEEMMGRPPTDFMFPEDTALARERFERRLEGSSERANVRMRRADGSEFWGDFAMDALHDEAGVVIGAIAVVSDVTAQRAATRELEETQSWLNAVVSALDEVLYVGAMHPDGSYEELFAGPGTERMLGGHLGDGENGSDAWEATIHPDDREVYEELNARILRGEDGEAEYRMVGRDGVTRWVLDRVRPRLPAREDGAIVFDGLAADVTRRRQGDDELATVLAELASTNAALEESRNEAERLAATDALTGVGNRRHFDALLIAELSRSAREGHTPGVIMIDVDHFKRVNDTHGHAVGDQVLVGVADRLRTNLRAYDSIARWGGEEFVVLVPAVPDEDALRAIGEHLRVALASTPIASDAGDLVVTASFGATRLFAPTAGGSVVADVASGLIESADSALYAAKRRGRNRVVLASELRPTDVPEDDPEVFRLAEGLAIAASVREAIPPLHCQQVADLAGDIARRLELPHATVQRCRLGGWLHDVGKLAIPDEILKRWPLSEAERAVLQQHAVIGERIIDGVPSLRDVAPAVRHHHEKVDGSGYPDRLVGDDIPIEARIVAAADAYSAITAGRAYQRALSPGGAIEQLRRSADVSLDAAVVEALAAAIEHRLRTSGIAPAAA